MKPPTREMGYYLILMLIEYGLIRESDMLDKFLERYHLEYGLFLPE